MQLPAFVPGQRAVQGVDEVVQAGLVPGIAADDVGLRASGHPGHRADVLLIVRQQPAFDARHRGDREALSGRPGHQQFRGYGT